MRVENELAEIVTIGDHEFEEYEEEILMREEVLEPSTTNSGDTAPAKASLGA